MTHLQTDILIGRIAKGDMGALEELYNGLAKQVYAFALSISKNHQLAQDVMQDTFVKIYQNAKSFKQKGAGTAWAMRIARNLTYDVLASKNASFTQLEESMVADVSTEESALTRALLSEAAAGLNDAEREVISLHAVSGLKLSEIAEILEQPVGTVKWRHSQAIKKMKEYIGTEVAQ